MDFWKTAIEAFDRDLSERMKVITSFESCSFSGGLEQRLLKAALGFPDRHFLPRWLNKHSLWVHRNRERVNERERLRYRRKASNGLGRIRSYSELKKYQDVYYLRKKARREAV